MPVRLSPVLFAATLNVTVPFPLPLAPPVTVIQFAWLVAVHGHPVAVTTDTRPFVPPSFSNEVVVEERTNMHPFACVTETGCPATVNVVVRAGPVFG